jgi:PAS domain S-box-containing protein
MEDPQAYAQRIHRVVAALSHRVTADEVADALVHEVAGALGAAAASVFLFDDERNCIVSVRAVGYSEDVLERWRGWPIDSSPLLSGVRAGVPAFTRSRLADSRFDPALAEDLGDGAGFLVPLEAGGRVLGCLAASYDHVRDFTGEDRELIVTLAAHSAQSFERARLFEAERAARAAADAARRELEALLHQLPIAVVVIGMDGRVLLNAATQAIYGTSASRGTLPGGQQPLGRMRHLDGRIYKDAEVPIVRALGGESVVGEEMLFRRSDDVERLVRVNAAPVRDDAGRIGSAVAVFSDITEERRVQEALLASERRYRAVVRATNDVIWDFDPVHNHLDWSDALTRVFGHDREETNRPPRRGFGWWVDHIHPDDRAALVESYTHARQKGADSWSGRYRFRRADGTYVATIDRCVFERDAAGEVVRVIGAVSDVSEQERLVDELRGAVEVRDDFLSCAGHELRTPLAALSAQLLGLERLPLGGEKRAAKLAAAKRQVARLSTLVDELLNVSRIVHGELRLEREAIDLVAVVEEAAARLADDFARGGTELELDAPASVVGEWDRLRIDLVITNLLTNALRYGERRPVRVTVEAAGAMARVSVEDRGIGIPKEDQQRIFERFVRAVPSRQFGGLGIGLWLSRQVVDAHQGTLTVVSEPGGGARFTVELPRAAP